MAKNKNHETYVYEDDIKMLMCYGLCCTETAYKHIDKIYLENPDKYDEYAKSSEYYHYGEKRVLTEEIYYKRALGIMLSGEYDNINYIVRMSFKNSDKFIQNNNPVAVGDFVPKLINDKKLYFGQRCAIVFLTLFHYKDKKVLDKKEPGYEWFLKGAVALKEYLAISNVLYENLEKYNTKENEKIIKRIKEILFKRFPKLKDLTLDFVDKSYSVTEKFDQSVYYSVEFEGINLESIYNTVPRKKIDKHVTELIKLWFFLGKDKLTPVVNYGELYSFIYTNLHIILLAEKYREAKKDYFETGILAKENINAKNREISETNQKLIECESKLHRLSKNNQEKINSLKSENKKLKNKVKELEKLLATYPDTKEELTELRNLMFNLSEEEDAVIENTVDLDKLNSLNAICIGGTEAWITSMKEVLPNWTFIPVGIENYDTRLLKGKEYIFINTKANIHGMYYRAIENKDKDTKLRYINSLNRDRVLKEIEESL